jgi:hypothetical protein
LPSYGYFQTVSLDLACLSYFHLWHIHLFSPEPERVSRRCTNLSEVSLRQRSALAVGVRCRHAAVSVWHPPPHGTWRRTRSF